MASLDARPPRRLRHVLAVQFWHVRLPPDALVLRERGPLDYFVEVHVSVPASRLSTRSVEGTHGNGRVNSDKQPDFVSGVSRNVCSDFSLGGHTDNPLRATPLDAKRATVLLCCQNSAGCRRDRVVVATSELDFTAPLCDANVAPLTAPNTLVLRMNDGSMCVTAQPDGPRPDSGGGREAASGIWHSFSGAQAKLAWPDACSNITHLLKCLADLAGALERQQAAQAQAAAAVGAMTASFGARIAETSHLQHRLDALRTRRYELHRRAGSLGCTADAMRGELEQRRAALDASRQWLHGQQAELQAASAALDDAADCLRPRLRLLLQGLCHVRWLAVGDVSRIYPITLHPAGDTGKGTAGRRGSLVQASRAAMLSGAVGGGALSICGAPLVSGLSHSGVVAPQEAAVRDCSAAALGHVAAAVALLERVLGVPLRYGLLTAGSRSLICDRASMALQATRTGATSAVGTDDSPGLLTTWLPLHTTGCVSRVAGMRIAG